MADPTLETVLRRSPDVVHRNLEGEAVLVDLRTGSYFGLDPVGTRIWESLTNGAPLRTVLEVVLDEFDVAEAVARSDLLRLAGELLQKGLVMEAAPSPTPRPGR